MKLVLLPGLDGTGELFSPLTEALQSYGITDIQIVRYHPQRMESYDTLVEHLLTQLPKEEYVLFAESFSGPIAYRIAQQKPKHLASLIIAASFLKNPRPFLLHTLKFLPANLFAYPMPRWLIRLFLLGKEADDALVGRCQEAIAGVSSKVLMFRLNEIRKLQERSLDNAPLEIPTLYIQVQEDILVREKSFEDWKAVCAHITRYRVKGKHLIAQSNPQKCALAIAQRFYYGQH